MRCGRWATSKADRTTRDPGQPGVRLRCSWTCARSSAHSPPARAPGEVARCCSALTCHGRAGGPGRTRTRFRRQAGWVEGMGLRRGQNRCSPPLCPTLLCGRVGRASRSCGWGFVLSVVHCGHGSGPSGVKGPGPVVASVGEPLTSGESGAK
ncbi:DUF6207 family protein [Streptomyces sp. NPDC005486]|uniref:DUF6207 family protein n=1 Tax=Streptomyces sp. NPDC005486 TaxID=3155345 RepID=UPI0033A1DFB2